MSHPASVLLGTRGERVALCDVSVSAALHDLLAEVSVKQTYRNDEQANIEAVYTFPLPLDAMLLDLTVTIGERTLTGTVVEKKAAETRYEDAIAGGNSAVMLEQLEPGLYAMNVGNLLPAETAVIAITYAVTYRWAGDHLRMLIPTTIAPRYGTSPFAPHQTPESSLTVENQFSIQVEVFGSLREARFECPSHEVTLTSSSDKAVIALSRTKAAMDRDFVLNVKAPQAAHSFALCGADGDGTAIVAGFQPVFPGLRQPRSLNLAVVVDCSGSMQGDSIVQARQALTGMLDGLQPGDRVTIVAFGNSTKTLFDDLRPCTDANLRLARQFVAEVQADMGGTEIGRALQAAYAATSGSEAADIFLVTDGEVSEWAPVVAVAKTSGRRIFTVGVGHAVSEAFVRELATVTKGECELVSPREGMADRVVRHFERMRAPRAKRVVVHWPEGARHQTPARFNTVFEGDSVLASAQFDRPSVTGHVVMEIETETGQVARQELAIGQPQARHSGSHVSTVARLAAAARMKGLDRDAAVATAVQYQLTSEWTNWLVVAERPAGEQVFEIPALRKVPNTLAASWGGRGLAMPAARMAAFSRISGAGGRLVVKLARLEKDALPMRRSLLEFGDLADQADRLIDAVAALAAQTRDTIEPLQRGIDQLFGHVTSELRAIERQAADLQRALDELVRRSGGSRHPEAVAELHGRLESLRERLVHLQEALVRLRHCQELFREMERALLRG